MSAGIDESRAILVATLAATLLAAPRRSLAAEEIEERVGVDPDMDYDKDFFHEDVAGAAVGVARELVAEAYRQCPVTVEPTKPPVDYGSMMVGQ